MQLALVFALATLSKQHTIISCNLRVYLTNEDSSYEIKFCNFLSFTQNAIGGAVYISNRDAYFAEGNNLYVECASYTSLCGAEYLAVKSINSTAVTAHQCYAFGKGQFAIISSSTAKIERLSLSNCGNKLHQLSSATLKLLGYDQHLKFSNFSENWVAKSDCAMENSDVSSFIMEFSDFTNNFASSTILHISIKEEGSVYSIVFYNNSQASSESGLVFFENCANILIDGGKFTYNSGGLLFSSLSINNSMILITNAEVEFGTNPLKSGNITFCSVTFFTPTYITYNSSNPFVPQDTKKYSMIISLIVFAALAVIGGGALIFTKILKERSHNPLIDALLLQNEIDKDFG